LPPVHDNLGSLMAMLISRNQKHPRLRIADRDFRNSLPGCVLQTEGPGRSAQAFRHADHEHSHLANRVDGADRFGHNLPGDTIAHDQEVDLLLPLVSEIAQLEFPVAAIGPEVTTLAP
jgi:hypothetical protein